MIDKRELILARLEELIKTVPGVVLSGRNLGPVSKARRPAIILDDGAESHDEADESAGGARNSSVQRMRMDVVFRILLGEVNVRVGPQANEMRAELLRVLWSDAELFELLGVNTSRRSRIVYTGGGLVTDAGETREGTMEVSLALTYVFKIADLLA